MKHLSLFTAFFFVVALGAAGCGVRAAARTRPAAPAQRVVVDVSIFYDDLAPYGRWFTLDDYGWVWTPYGVSAGWRPYTFGLSFAKTSSAFSFNNLENLDIAC